ncbi:hypothetical protein J1N35_042045 [Gossypium stocksii]|uniref:Nitronate monooxygenase domain-containing protein n=1 Tax=Gossypium stocksii TaxID=47602 RepID=A0A9D3ZJU9_9ROSI|nr:hypothetical protein J1N35_042045 [Gossypium stocksii]
MGWKGILGFDYGIVLAPMGHDIAGPELVAAVANAGALGLLHAPDWDSPEQLKELIRKTRELTDKPFGVGVLLPFPHKENIKAILEEKVAVLQVAWGECSKELVLEAHNAGIMVVPQVGSLEEAKKVIDAGVDAIIVQGYEAGGHVIGQDGLISLLPRVVDAVADHDIPVIAAGGIVDARGYVAALALGAKGICMGTSSQFVHRFVKPSLDFCSCLNMIVQDICRFLATQESYAHPTYKQKLIEHDETEYTDIFGRALWPGAPQRVLRTPFVCDWKSLPAHENESNQPVIGRSLIHGMETEIQRFSASDPNPTTTGEIENMALYAGQSVGLIKEILPAGEVVKRLVEGAQHLIRQRFNEDSV